MSPVLHHLLARRATTQGCSPGAGGAQTSVWRGCYPASGNWSLLHQAAFVKGSISRCTTTPKKFVSMLFCVLYSKTRIPIHAFPGRAWFQHCCGSPVRASLHRDHPSLVEQLLPPLPLCLTCLGARMRNNSSPPGFPEQGLRKAASAKRVPTIICLSLRVPLTNPK